MNIYLRLDDEDHPATIRPLWTNREEQADPDDEPMYCIVIRNSSVSELTLYLDSESAGRLARVVGEILEQMT